MVLPAPVSVEVGLLAWALSKEELGVPHLVVSGPRVWQPRVTRSDFEERARAECERLGWLDHKGRLDTEVRAALMVLCQASSEFFGWLDDGERTIGVLAAAIRQQALLAVRDGDLVRLRQIRSSKLPEMLVGQIPAVPAGRGWPVRITRAELIATTRDGRRRSSTGVGSYPASGPAKLVRQLADLPALGAGELHVAARDSVGRRRAIPEPLRYVDTSRGRYAYQITTVAGDEHVLVVGVTHSDLIARLRDAQRSLS